MERYIFRGRYWRWETTVPTINSRFPQHSIWVVHRTDSPRTDWNTMNHTVVCRETYPRIVTLHISLSLSTLRVLTPLLSAVQEVLELGNNVHTQPWWWGLLLGLHSTEKLLDPGRPGGTEREMWCDKTARPFVCVTWDGSDWLVRVPVEMELTEWFFVVTWV